MKPIRWSALTLTLGLSLGLVGCPEGDEYDLPGGTYESEPLERDREGPGERREGLYGDEGPVLGDEGPARGEDPNRLDPDGDGVGGGRPPGGMAPPDAPEEGVHEEAGIPPVSNESANPMYRDQGETGGGETPHPQQTQRDQIHPGQ